MNVIKLNRNDLSEMIRRTVNSLLSESVREEMGSIAASKENVINEIVEYIETHLDATIDISPDALSFTQFFLLSSEDSIVSNSSSVFFS